VSAALVRTSTPGFFSERMPPPPSHGELGTLRVDDLVADTGRRRDEIDDELERVSQVVNLPEDKRSGRKRVLVTEAE
jgi:hypothetical protein